MKMQRDKTNLIMTNKKIAGGFTVEDTKNYYKGIEFKNKVR